MLKLRMKRTNKAWLKALRDLDVEPVISGIKEPIYELNRVGTIEHTG